MYQFTSDFRFSFISACYFCRSTYREVAVFMKHVAGVEKLTKVSLVVLTTAQ